MTQLTPFTHPFDGELLSGVHAVRDHGGTRPTVVVLHGAGNGNKAPLFPLVRDFAARENDALAFDFSGHGESSGHLGELSLRRRFDQAASVIEGQVPAEAPLVLVGFSMSGQTLADLARHFGPRVTALGLCAPAVYAAEAWEVPFGTGDGPFSEIIRRPGSWRDSPALAALRAYEGRAVLAVPRTDEVIPPDVTRAIRAALTERARLTPVEYPEATHRLGSWFGEHPADRAHFVATMLPA
ncbi:alpha/beta hydrolase [Streptomyces iconiensis]|uniref:Alpha/beta fold hydrolase n=1 Tax=Streptomyces iconiensis TaxID=1384038 RepID=A0ABT6ZNU2_9ACTN|nr:alpha/beta fold hydrolase [Streptomyces iconiensis]MDJ1130729.1 alpha/beta fold hydrolase [Streptomyces iconiensis]